MRQSRSVLTGVNTEGTVVCGQFPGRLSSSSSFPLVIFLFLFFLFFNSSALFQTLMVLRLACYLQLQNKGRCSTLPRGRAKLFWEGCLPTA